MVDQGRSFDFDLPSFGTRFLPLPVKSESETEGYLTSREPQHEATRMEVARGDRCRTRVKRDEQRIIAWTVSRLVD